MRRTSESLVNPTTSCEPAVLHLHVSTSNESGCFIFRQHDIAHLVLKIAKPLHVDIFYSGGLAAAREYTRYSARTNQRSPSLVHTNEQIIRKQRKVLADS